jgi:hypothetical protein|tara:strand:+ start:326 stop:664 length:339 start_codon:yes stop_codon:yes gene_type:complete
MEKRIPPSEDFIIRLLQDKDKGLTGKQIREFHGLTKNQYDHIVYRIVPKLKKSSTFVSKLKSAQSQAKKIDEDMLTTFRTGASPEVWQPSDEEDKKKNIFKRLVSKIFFWYK